MPEQRQSQMLASGLAVESRLDFGRLQVPQQVGKEIVRFEIGGVKVFVLLIEVYVSQRCIILLTYVFFLPHSRAHIKSAWQQSIDQGGESLCWPPVEKFVSSLEIPAQIGHPFRSKSATCSDPNRPGIPEQIGHPYEG